MTALVSVVTLLKASFMRLSYLPTCSGGNLRSGSPGSEDGHAQGGGAICHVDRRDKGLVFDLHVEDGLVEDDPYM